MAIAVGWALAVLAAPVVGCGLYLLTLALASLVRPAAQAPAPAPSADEVPRLAVLVPAHNEADFVAETVRSLLEQDYPAEARRLFVIADNCTDLTAQVAAAAGAEVLTRIDAVRQGKGHALRWAMDQLLASDRPPDAFVVVDADSVADRGMLRALVAATAGGREAVQAEYLVRVDGESARARLQTAGLLLFHRVRLAGRARLGLASALVGNGMLFTRNLLERHPWDAFTGAEDLEFTLRLRLAGVRVAYAGDASVRGAMPASYGAMTGQRMRWEGGRLHMARAWSPRLIKHAFRSDPGVLETLTDLVVPPLGMLAMLAAGGLVVSTGLYALGLVPSWTPLPWLAAGVLLASFVLVGLRSAGAPIEIYGAMLEAPRFLAWKAVTYVRLLRGFDPGAWERTERVAR